MSQQERAQDSGDLEIEVETELDVEMDFEDEPAGESALGGVVSGVVGWAKAIAGGIGDTAKAAMSEGKAGAAEAQDEAWVNFRSKTTKRRSNEKHEKNNKDGESE